MAAALAITCALFAACCLLAPSPCASSPARLPPFGWTSRGAARDRQTAPSPRLCVCTTEGSTSKGGGGGVSRPAMARRDIVFVTGNKNKLEEVKLIFKKFYQSSSVPFNLTNQDIDLPEHQGEIDTICKIKARSAYTLINGPCMVEDTSLCFNALGGLPGPYIKWFLEKTGPSGLYCMLKGFEDKSAVAVCTVGYVNEKGDIQTFSGKTNGTIVEPKIKDAFGWDSCFKPDGFNITYAEMSREDKNRISHRGKAIFQLKEFLDQDPSN